MADAGAPTGTDLPWQHMTAAAGLVLAAPVPALDMDPGVLEADLRAVKVAVPVADRSHVPHMAGWCNIELVGSDRAGNPVARPAFRLMAGVAARLADSGLTILSAFIIRNAAGWILDWHYDPLAPHREVARLILPIRTSPGSTTWMGHEAHHWPAGRCWAADFTQPHRVDTDPAADRIILSLDVRMDAVARALLPMVLQQDADRRMAVQQDAVNSLLAFRAAA